MIKEVCEHNLEIKLVSCVEHVCSKCGFRLGEEKVCDHDWDVSRTILQCAKCAEVRG